MIPELAQIGTANAPPTGITPILDGIESSLLWPEPLRLAQLALMEQEMNLHPGEIFHIQKTWLEAMGGEA